MSGRGRSNSPYQHRKHSTPPFSSSSSSNSFGKLMPRSCSSSATSFYSSSNGGYNTRSVTPSRSYSNSGYGARTPVNYPSPEELESPVDSSRSGGDSISVTIRFRPLSEREYQIGDELAWYADGDKIVRNEYNPMTSYAFDKVFGPSTATQEVYEVAGRPVVKNAMEGINGTVFAYGVTSSGKTHTMHGDQNSPGIIPLAIKDVFSIIQDTPGREFLLRVSYLEIYNEVINDLLDPTGQNLRVREDAQGTYVEGIKEEVVLSPGHALSFIAAGEEHRHVGSNNFNLFSSRSHTIFTLMIESSAHGDEYDGVIFSQLNLIDLAGSESSKTETTGLRRKEGSYINKSLLTLGTVIGKLSEGKASHVPYRDSKLTRLLQSSLSGHGHVSLICTITPASSNMEETHNTLKFASRAKRVEIYASRNKIIDEKSLIKKYQREISVLKDELDQLRRGMLVGIHPEEIMTLKQKLEEGQVKMQSRLEEEEEAKAALMSRIQRLTKLILVSSKNSIPGLSEISGHQGSLSVGEDDKLDVLGDGSVLMDGENQNTIGIESYNSKQKSSSKWNDDLSTPGSTMTESLQTGELISGSSCGSSGSAESLDQAIRGLAEFLMIVLEDNSDLLSPDETVNGIAGMPLNKDISLQSVLEDLRHLPVNAIGQSQIVVKDVKNVVVDGNVPAVRHMNKGTKSREIPLGRLHVDRTKEWILKTSAHVTKLLSATFPNLCVHPAQKVRRALLAAVEGLLSRCYYTLKESRLVFLECSFVLVCDDFEEVSEAAQVFLGNQFSSRGKHDIKHDVAQIFSRLTKKLPNMVLGSEEALAISHAQKLLVLIYFSGPSLVKDHLLQSPATAAQFLDSFALCLGQNSAFAGSLQNLIIARPSSTGYLHSIAEMRSVNSFSIDDKSINQSFSSKEPKFLGTQKNGPLNTWENVHNKDKLPRMPPWFVHVGSDKLYLTLARILRLVGLSLVADSQSEASLSVVADIPLGYLRKLVSEIRIKSYSKESWKSWYRRTGSGRLVRQASVAACILNEMIYGLSDQAIDAFSKMFHIPCIRWEVDETAMVDEYSMQQDKVARTGRDESVWRFCHKDGRSHLIDCVGSVLHEYLSSEIWDLPSAKQDFVELSDIVDGDITLHFFHDNAMMHQVVIDGIGIFNMCLGGDFTSCGFLHSSLYVLLESLICSNFQIRSASDVVLHVIAATSGYPTVGHLVVDNSDYIIDFICQQLRHLDLNPHVPGVLAAMLSYIGAAHNILPLLEEPMRSVSLELEILGRHQHPELTIPFLKAVAEIVKASKREAVTLCSQAESYLEVVKSKMSAIENKIKCDIGAAAVDCEKENSDFTNNVDAYMEEVESTLLTVNDFRRYRRTVGSIIGSCVTAVTPLLISAMQVASLVAFDIIEDCVMALAKVEAAYKDEKQTMVLIEEIVELCSRYDLKDALDADENATDENRLLPAMNKIWPFLVSCFRSGNQLAVRKCSAVISSSVQVCGGDFFSRRFYTDGGHFWKLLNTSPFKKKPISKEERTPLQLPYRSTHMVSENSMSEVSDLKVQVAVLNMIGDISRNKRSASALDAVLKKVSGIVVGIACSGVTGLRDASINALAGLASIDPDLVWLLLADVNYSTKKNTPPQPTADFPKVNQILPLPQSTKDYLYVQYGGQSYGFDIDFASVEIVFKKLHSQVFTTQFYI